MNAFMENDGESYGEGGNANYRQPINDGFSDSVRLRHGWAPWTLDNRRCDHAFQSYIDGQLLIAGD
jgi:hypothetical protein